MTSVSLLASATRLPARSAASVASRPGGADDRVDHDVDVGVGRRLRAARRARSDSAAPSSPPASPAKAGLPLRHLRVERLDVPARRQGHDPEVLALAPQHGERAPADRAGRAQHRHAATVAGAIGHRMIPNRRYIAAATGTTK